MTTGRRILKINSLLKEVITEVIQKELQHAGLPEFTTITSVDTSGDLQYAKVYISVLTTSDEKTQDALKILNHNAKHITFKSTRMVSLRYFPELTFIHDKGMLHQQNIDKVFHEINTNTDTPSSA